MVNCFAILKQMSEKPPRIVNNAVKKRRKEEIAMSDNLNFICIKNKKCTIHFAKLLDTIEDWSFLAAKIGETGGGELDSA